MGLPLDRKKSSKTLVLEDLCLLRRDSYAGSETWKTVSLSKPTE